MMRYNEMHSKEKYSDEESYTDESTIYTDEDYNFSDDEQEEEGDHNLCDSMYEAFAKMEIDNDILEDKENNSFSASSEPFNAMEPSKDVLNKDALNKDVPSRCTLLQSAKLLSSSEKRNFLVKIENKKDKVLQILLWSTGFRFSLQEHQFEAVRKVAGLPTDFPFHYGSKMNNFFQQDTVFDSDNLYLDDLLQQRGEFLFHRAVSGLVAPNTRGFCLGDAMGLGKTVEAIAGAMLRNSVREVQDKFPLPILIISPNDAVQEQWYETLINNGVSRGNIVLFKKEMDGSTFLGTSKFVLLTRHTATAHFKNMFHRSNSKDYKSPLFPQSHPQVIEAMYHEKNVEKGLVKFSWRQDGERHEDTITRIARESLKNTQYGLYSFQLVLIDEAHFLKNRLTFATMACILSCTNAERVVPLTGTPYNNGIGDLATIMTLVDPFQQSSTTKWWQEKINEGNIRAVARKWRERYLIRREKDEIKLPAKKVSSLFRVKTTFDDLDIVYIKLEDSLHDVLKSLANLMNDPNADQKRLRSLRQAMVSIASEVRMANIHPLLPNSGREITKLFSPTRRKMATVKNSPEKCVCCMRSSIGTTNSQDFVGIDDLMETGVQYKDDDVENYDTTDTNLCILPKHLCKAQHKVHPQCLKGFKHGNYTCPRCWDLEIRRKSNSPENKKFYCKNVVLSMPEGFAASPKLQELIKFIEKRKTDKVIIVSYYKGALDLVEGILHFDLKYPCSRIARFDGDITCKKKRNEELNKFKTNKSCRFLLMTAQSGGVGLNLTEARRLAILDRWWNPFVNEQVEDRIHRIGQEKDVEIRYFDTAGTIDEVMIKINDAKKKNSNIIFENQIIDSKKNGSKNVNDSAYLELAGTLRRLIEVVRNHRNEQYEKNIKMRKCDPSKFEIPMIKANVLQSGMRPCSTPVKSNCFKKAAQRSHLTPVDARAMLLAQQLIKK